jgi:hypothetical protein
VIGTASIYVPGDHVLALCHRGRERYWQPGVVRSVNSASARVALGGGATTRVPLDRLRLSAVR